MATEPITFNHFSYHFVVILLANRAKGNDLSFASTETKFKNPITKAQNNFLVNTGFLVKLFQKKPNEKIQK